MDESWLTLLLIALGTIYEGSRRGYIASLRRKSGQDEDEDEVIDITSRHFVIFPMVASFSLLMLYLFFDKLQLIYIVLLSITAATALYRSLSPAVTTMLRWILGESRDTVVLTRWLHHVITGGTTLAVTAAWFVWNSYMLLNVMGVALSIFMLSTLQLANAKTAVLLGTALLLYDVFWVFVSPYLFTDNVMVEVARKTAHNPAKQAGQSLHLNVSWLVSHVELPVKLMVRSWLVPTHVSMLGLGDIVLPGVVCAYCWRCDMELLRDPILFKSSMIAYGAGLCLAMLAARCFATAQPALLYIVPVLLPAVLLVASRRHIGREFWAGVPRKEIPAKVVTMV